MKWHEALWEVPMKGIVLMYRENEWQKDMTQITLEDKEFIDNRGKTYGNT